MISFRDAQKKIMQNARLLSTETVLLKNAAGRIISSGLRSLMSLPSFDNSAMDGFVLNSADVKNSSAQSPARLEIAGSIRAGASKRVVLKRGETFRIMTGAPIPQGADAVLEKEKALEKEGCLRITEPIRKGRHVRTQGEEIVKGSRIDMRGTVVTPGVIGFLSSLGVERIDVRSKPRVSLIATGDELVSCGNKLKAGQIYDSNTPMLLAALHSLGIIPGFVSRVTDRKDVLRAELRKALKQSDLVILTGGVSVGDFDHVKGVFRELGVKSIFWKVAQKPGKPMFFGKKGGALVFGLPGNPAAVHACFYQYIYPAIRSLMGHQDALLKEESPVLKNSIWPDCEKTLFLKAKVGRAGSRAHCEALGHQGSHMLSSLCLSDGFIVVPPGGKAIKKGQKIRFQYLPETKSS